MSSCHIKWVICEAIKRKVESKLHLPPKNERDMCVQMQSRKAQMESNQKI
jgi:hypothetical protein